MSGNVTRTFDDVQARIDEANARTLTATVGGANIDADATFVHITCTDATHIVNLPAAVNGKVIRLTVDANGCEVRSVVAADKLNNVVIGATNEAPLLALALYTCVYNAVTGNWTCDGVDNAAVAVAAVVPNAV